ncbi:hypothetical protein [Streptomyces sp. MJP52]|nr:hypothetical protein [Streptomyces sp. MJP52]MDH6224336.1 putative amidophosphoribosyltransferase [Streptomyces sp. MJP52]
MTRLVARLLHLLGASGQCSRCGGWFPDWSGGICDACTAAGR